MFGWRKAKDQCPFCGYEYSFKFKHKAVEIADPPLPNRKGYGVVDGFECKFCKRSLTVVYSPSEKHAIIEDDAYIKMESEFEKVSDQLDEMLSQLEEDFEEAEPDSSKAKQLQKKIESTEAKMEKAEEAYNKKLEKWDEQSERAQRRLLEKERD